MNVDRMFAGHGGDPTRVSLQMADNPETCALQRRTWFLEVDG